MAQLKTKFITDNAVTNAKLAQAPTLTIKGNDTGGTANEKDLTVAEVNAMLGTNAALASSTLTTASFTGIPTYFSTPVTITANNPGTAGNSVYIPYDPGQYGPETLSSLIAAWNLSNPGNMVTL